MIELKWEQAGVVEHLFRYTHLSLVKSWLQGCMGRAWADDAAHPSCAQITVGDFSFVAGDAQCAAARELVCNLPKMEIPALLFVPQNEDWVRLIEEQHPGHTYSFTRYATKKAESFPIDRLRAYADALPPGHSLRRIDEELYHKCMQSPLRDLCAQFGSAGEYLRLGLGFCAVADGEPVGGASSYTVFDRGLEIEVDTLPAHRRRGIAAACSAKLILTCVERGIYPCWDAANLESLALAEKLGYSFSHEYVAYAVVVGAMHN